MAVIQRPVKEGNATTYQGKVALGYTDILASEVDDDLDKIYAAWNGGVDTVNIVDGSITGAKLAPGAVGSRELATGAAAANLGPAGGDLRGSYPTPTVVGVTGGTLVLNPRGMLQANPANVFDVGANVGGSPAYDATKPQWLLRLNYGGDELELWRTPVGGSGALLFTVNNAGKVSGGCAVGARVHIVPPAFTTTTYNTPVLVCTLPSITTRGGAVLLTMMHTIYYTSSSTSGNVPVYVMIYRDGAQIAIHGTNIGSGGGQIVVPVPVLVHIDNTASPGAHTYDLRVQLGSATSASLVTNQFGDCIAQEIG